MPQPVLLTIALTGSVVALIAIDGVLPRWSLRPRPRYATR
jgi:hypothetical protein